MANSVEQLLAQLRKAAKDRQGVMAVIEVRTTCVINLDTDEEQLSRQTEEDLRKQIAAAVRELQGNLGIAENLEVAVIEARDAVDDHMSIDIEPSREVFAGHLTVNGVTLTADFDVAPEASTAEKDAAFLAALSQQGRIDFDYLSIGQMAAERVEARKKTSGPTDCITRIPVGYWNSNVYRGDERGEKDFELEIDDQRAGSGKVFLTLGARDGQVDDHLGAVMEVARLPGGADDLQSLRLTQGDNLIAIFYKKGDSVIVRPENGLHVEAVVLPDGEHAQAWM